MSAPPALRTVLAPRGRPAPPGRLSASLTFGRRAVLKIRHVPDQLVDATLFPVMFTLTFTYLFGGALAGSTAAYLDFVLPGILAQTVLFITMYGGATLTTDLGKGVFDRFRTLPVWRPSPIVGMILGDAVRYTLAAAICLALGMALGFRPRGGVGGVVLAVALVELFAFGVAWIWTALGLLLRTPTAVLACSSFLLFPLTFASNIFVDPRTMPSWLRAFVAVNPVSRLVSAVRGLLHGAAQPGDVAVALATCAVLVAVFGPLTMYLYRRER